jgi:predicted metal-dependent hydrolase
MTENNETNALVDDPTLNGQVEDAGNAGVEEAQAEPELFDIANYADKAIKVQVDGQELTIPLQEAIAGYQRQADYTRKTQELSEQRKQVQIAVALQDALVRDPAGTLKTLQEHYGLGTAPQAQQQEEQWLDPAEQQIRSLEQRLAAFEQKQAYDDLTRTVNSLQSKYGEEFNAEEVVTKALELGNTDLEAVFKQIAFDKIYSKANEASKKLTEDQSRKEAKRQATIVSSTSSAKTGTTPVAQKPSTVFEAFEQAKKTLNL